MSCAEITTTGTTEIPLSLGSDDGLAVFVNGERVLADNRAARCADQNKLTLRLKPGKNTVLLKITQGYGEWAFYYAAGQPTVAAFGWFDDVSTTWGLGPNGLGGEARGATALAIADVDGDGKSDFLYSAGNGLLFMNTGKRFELKNDSGIAFDTSRCGPTFIDYDHDGHPDLFVPQPGKAKLFRNDGKGHFTNVIDQCGDLAKSIAGATSAAWGDFNNDGHPDVFIGCLRGPNRYLENNGNGTFTDKSAEIGLTLRVFNSQAIAVADLNHDGKLDLMMANEGQDAAILFGNKELPNKATPLVVHVPCECLGCAATVKVIGKDVNHTCSIRGGDGRGQPNLAPRFVLPPGTYQVVVSNGNGKSQTKNVTLTTDAAKVRFDEVITAPKK